MEIDWDELIAMSREVEEKNPESLAKLFIDLLQKEYAAGLIGILFGVIGILTSPILLALLSMPTITIHQYQGVSI